MEEEALGTETLHHKDTLVADAAETAESRGLGGGREEDRRGREGWGGVGGG